MGEHSQLPATTDGTVDGLLRLMTEHGVEKSVVLSIATKKEQVEPILHWSEEIASDRIIPFASLHPDLESLEEKMGLFVKAGIRGVKLHPLYQGFLADDPRFFPIYDAVAQAEMVLLSHAGYDIAFGEKDNASPKRFARVVAEFPKLKLVLAHFGGWKQLNPFIDHLAGKDVYIDISFTPGYCSTEQLQVILLRHDTNRILFGSDSPWGKIPEHIRFVREMPVSDCVKERVFFFNASRLLGFES